MKYLSDETTCKTDQDDCDALHPPVRMNYFHGQLISERDLKTEQAYFRDKLRHANRCLHGYGVLCGMVVEPVPPSQDCLPDDSKRRKEIRRALAELDREIDTLKQAASATEGKGDEKAIGKKLEARAAAREALRQEFDALTNDRPDQSDDSCDDQRAPIHLVRVSRGAAIDCDGYDIILPRALTVDVAGLLKASERARLGEGVPLTVYLSVCYEECGRELSRPFALDDCATTTACQASRIAEGARIIASLSQPEPDGRCDLCCECCDDPCLLLAAIEIIADEPIEADDIDHSGRRRFGLYEATVITGISWRHGASYTAKTANGLLGTRDDTGGIEIVFSRPVHVATLKPGVIELQRVTGGRGLSGIITAMEGEYVGLPDDGMVDRVRYRDATGETVQPKDRIMIVVRAPFILDRCCRPVEGLHLGGRVPLLASDGQAAEAARAEEATENGADDICLRPPGGPMPWTSSGAGNFESWFSVTEE